MKPLTVRELQRLPVKNIMKSAMLTVRDDMRVGDAAAFLTDNEISGAPVTDESGRFVGVISLTDIARDLAEHGQAVHGRFLRNYYAQGWEDDLDPEDWERLVTGDDRVVRDVMTPTVFTVTEGTPLSELAETMIVGRVHRMFVTDQDHLVGIVTTLDIVKLLLDKG